MPKITCLVKSALGLCRHDARRLGGQLTDKMRQSKFVFAASSPVEGGEDPLIQTIGEIGTYQLFLFTITGYGVLIHGWQMLVNKFLTYPIPYQCISAGDQGQYYKLDEFSWTT